MTTYPPRGLSPWDQELKAYIDNSTAGSSTDAGVAHQIENGVLTQTAIAEQVDPDIAQSGTIFVSATGGNDSNDGSTWKKAKATIAAALATREGVGGRVVAGKGTHTVSSTGRFDTCTFTAGSSTIADTSIGTGDVGSYVISPFLRSPALIATVNAGVSFTITDQSGLTLTPESSGSSQSIITKPGLVVPAGVELIGLGPSWTRTQSVQNGVLDQANTWISDSGTGIAVLCGHWQDGGAANSGQRVAGTRLAGFAIKGNANNMFGLAQINNWTVVVKDVDHTGNGLGGLLVAGNANMTRFSDCRFSGNGVASATKVSAGVVVLDNTPLIPFGPTRYDNCFFTNNFGWGVVGTADFVTPKGARSVRISQGQFNHAKASTLTGSGTHAAVSGNEHRTMLDDCIFESADFLNLDVYDNPVTLEACKFKATGGTNGTLPFTVRVNAGAVLDATGCGFLDSTSHHVQLETGGIFNWHSCKVLNGSGKFVADSLGNQLVGSSDATLSDGSTIEPVNGQDGNRRPNETCSRLSVTSKSLAVVNQRLNLTYFTASQSKSVSQVIVESGDTPSGGTAVSISVGLYLVNGDGSLTQIAVTSGANQNAFQAADAITTLNFAASVFITARRRYAIGVLVNSSNTLPTFRGCGSTSLALSGSPLLCQVVTGQTSQPATIATGSLASGGTLIYSRLN